MTDHDEYFEYLKRRKPRAIVYRRHWLYPRLARRLRGHTLDIGCGIGDMLDFRPDTVGVDINARAVEFCRQRGLTAETMEIDRLPFEPGSFDSVLMDNVLEHIVEPAAILSEIRRVLRPSARFLVGVPGRRGWDSDPDHKIRYDDIGLVECIERHGFEHRETFHTPLWRSDFLDRNVRQYCIYGAFDRVG